MNAWNICLMSLALAGSQPAVPPDMTKLLATLREPDVETRHYAALALVQLGPSVVEPLNSTLRDKDRFARAGAAYAFSQLGLDAAPARANLEELLRDPEKDVRRQAAYAIFRLNSAEREATGTPAPPPVDFPKPEPRP